MNERFEQRVRRIAVDEHVSEDAARTLASFEGGEGGDMLIDGRAPDYLAQFDTLGDAIAPLPVASSPR